MKILLITPASDDDVHQRVLRELPFLGTDGFFAPHACAVVAGLTPLEHEVRIHDENLHGPVDPLIAQGSFDIVGLSLVANAYARAVAIAEHFRATGASGTLVAGGSCIQHMLDRLEDLVDVAFVGEAQETWPRFLKDLAAGQHQAEYRQVEKLDISTLPVPRWELIAADLPRYTVASVQTVRGCPHDCSFCDVIYTFGRKLRFKAIDQVMEEIRLLESLGVRMVFFADDNFAAKRKHTKELLRRLVELNKSFAARLSFATQLDITVAEDDELLQLMLDANMMEVQIGIESVDPAALQDIDKVHNLRFDLVQAVRKIQSYGIVVLAHMIIGMDSDDPSAFGRADRFLREAQVVHQNSHPLMAPPGTRLWGELQRQGRLVAVTAKMFDRLDMYTNVVPNGMTRIELFDGLRRHRQRVSEPEHFAERARGFLRGVQHQPSFRVRNEPSPWRMRKMLGSTLWYVLVQAEPRQRRVFLQLFKETVLRRPELLSKAVYATICHLMESRHAAITGQWAREMVAQERAMPGGPPRLAPETAPSEQPRVRAEGIGVGE